MSEEAEEVKPRKNKTPFKDREEFRKEITTFINRYKVVVADHADRISDYFEMSCFNYIVKFYELKGYHVHAENLQKGKYRYKCSPSGIQSNFSNFRVVIIDSGVTHKYEIHHNLSVESAHTKGIFTTPDITIIKMNGVEYRNDIYETKITFSHSTQVNLISFCEVKQFTPFPELLFNFIGTVNELMPSILTDEVEALSPEHIAPTLMISGVPNKQTKAIKASIEGRYSLNIIYELFYTATRTFSKKNLPNIRCIGKLPVPVIKDKIDDYLEILISKDKINEPRAVD